MAYYTQGQGLISQRRGSASYFYYYDGLGSTKALTDSNQNIQASYKYDAWGNILQTSGTITNPYLYVGELGYYADGDSGMYLLTQRWYSHMVGRFVVRDPIYRLQVEKGGAGAHTLVDVSPFMYGADSPTGTVDPSGLVTIQQCLDDFYKCMRDAEQNYKRCSCYFEQTTSCHEIVALGCATICTAACSLLKDPVAVGNCITWCTAGCTVFVSIGTDWAARQLAKLFLGICREAREIEIDTCYMAFEFCRERIHHGKR